MPERKKAVTIKPKTTADPKEQEKIIKKYINEELNDKINELEDEIERLKQDLDKNFEDSTLYQEMQKKIIAYERIANYEKAFCVQEIINELEDPWQVIQDYTPLHKRTPVIIQENLKLKADVAAKDRLIDYLYSVIAGVSPKPKKKKKKRNPGHQPEISEAERESIRYIRNHPTDPKRKFTPYAEIASEMHRSVGIVYRICNSKK